jgi:hypothetical protein
LQSGASGLSPANDHSVDANVGIRILPGVIAPPAQERKDVRADMIFAKKLLGPIGGRSPDMRKVVDACLPSCHCFFV